MITVPVLDGLQEDNIIGYLTINRDRLPKNTDWVLSLGFLVKECDLDEDYRTVVTEYELLSVSLQTDTNYMEYLKDQGINK